MKLKPNMSFWKRERHIISVYDRVRQ